MRTRDAVRAARFEKTRCRKDRKCYVLRCTLPPRRQRDSRNCITFFDPQDPEAVWKYACEEHSRGLRRVGKVYKAELKRLAQGAARVLARYGTDEEIDAYLAAERERARSENLTPVERLLVGDAPANVQFLRDLWDGLVDRRPLR